jgi:hypothetical protein
VKHIGDHQDIWNGVQGKHDDGLNHHFRVAETGDLVVRKVLVDPGAQGSKEVGLGARKSDRIQVENFLCGCLRNRLNQPG